MDVKPSSTNAQNSAPGSPTRVVDDVILAGPEYVLAMYDHLPQDHNSAGLPFRAGQVIRVLNRDPGGWWDGQLPEGRRGLFPSGYVNTDIAFLTEEDDQDPFVSSESPTKDAEDPYFVDSTISHDHPSRPGSANRYYRIHHFGSVSSESLYDAYDSDEASEDSEDEIFEASEDDRDDDLEDEAGDHISTPPPSRTPSPESDLDVDVKRTGRINVKVLDTNGRMDVFSSSPNHATFPGFDQYSEEPNNEDEECEHIEDEWKDEASTRILICRPIRRSPGPDHDWEDDEGVEDEWYEAVENWENEAEENSDDDQPEAEDGANSQFSPSRSPSTRPDRGSEDTEEGTENEPEKVEQEWEDEAVEHDFENEIKKDPNEAEDNQREVGANSCSRSRAPISYRDSSRFFDTAPPERIHFISSASASPRHSYPSEPSRPLSMTDLAQITSTYAAALLLRRLSHVSIYSEASSRTAETDYGFYYTRWALSQDSIVEENRTSIRPPSTEIVSACTPSLEQISIF